MGMRVTIPDGIIRDIQKIEYLIGNKGRTKDHDERIDESQRVQNHFSEAVYVLLVEKMKKALLLK